MRQRIQRPAAMQGRLALGAALCVIGFTLVFAAAVPEASPSSAASSSATRFLSQVHQPLLQYRAYRRMHARSEKFDQEAWLEARTELDNGVFRYEIVSERGSDYVRNKVLKSVLKREQQLVAEGDADRALLSTENYEFTDTAPPPGGDGFRYVLLKPKRKDVLLVDGRMVLSPDGRELVRVEGRLSKNPSFWTSLVNVTRHYAKVDGVRVPVSTESFAKVKLAGTARLEVTYDYEEINNRPVSLSARRIIAEAAGLTARD
jgi:hypothetical protein